jgi:hypothetical protein
VFGFGRQILSSSPLPDLNSTAKMLRLAGLYFLLSLAFGNAAAHYIFQKVALAGQAGGEYEGIRRNTNYNSPVTGE